MCAMPRTYLNWMIGAGALLAPAFAAAQQPAASGGFTKAQAEAGRTAYLSTCGNCHMPSMCGRTGDPSEVPPLSSLPVEYREFVKRARGISRRSRDRAS